MNSCTEMQSVKPVSEKYKKRKIASQVTKIMAEVEKGLDTDITTVGQSSNIVSEVAFESNSNTETENSSHVISNSMSLPVIANADAYNETDLIKTDDWLENTEWKSRTLNEMSFDDEADESDNLFNSLSNWAVSYNISLAALSSLLSILHSFIPNLPKDARTLLRTQRHVELLKISGGE